MYTIENDPTISRKGGHEQKNTKRNNIFVSNGDIDKNWTYQIKIKNYWIQKPKLERPLPRYGRKEYIKRDS